MSLSNALFVVYLICFSVHLYGVLNGILFELNMVGLFVGIITLLVSDTNRKMLFDLLTVILHLLIINIQLIFWIGLFWIVLYYFTNSNSIKL